MRVLSQQEKHQLENYIKSRADGQIMTIGNNIKMYFLRSVINEDFIIENIKEIYFSSSMNFDSYFQSIADVVNDKDGILKLIGNITKGDILVVYNNSLWSLPSARKKENRSISESDRESSFEGGMEGFIEDIDVNINLIMHYFHQPNMVLENFTVGTASHTRCCVMYDKYLVDPSVLESVKKGIKGIKAPVVQALSELQRLAFRNQFIIPRMLVTQRPDRSVKAITDGRIVVVLDGTPVSLILPVTFHEFMSTVDDRYLLPIPAGFLIVLRYFALLLSVSLPSWYIAITSYNPEILKVQLALSISASRSGVPYPSFVEVMIMLIMMEFLVEASIRLPKSIGQTATTVGGLILGQAATQAHLVSNIMIIIVATVAIANFIIPITSMNLAVRVMKYFMLFLSCFTGAMGITLALLTISCYLFSIHSFNLPFLDPVGKFSLEGLKSFFRKDINNES